MPVLPGLPALPALRVGFGDHVSGGSAPSHHGLPAWRTIEGLRASDRGLIKAEGC